MAAHPDFAGPAGESPDGIPAIVPGPIAALQNSSLRIKSARKEIKFHRGEDSKWKELGRGSFGRVFEATYRTEKVAVKRMLHRPDMDVGKAFAEFVSEVEIWNHMRHVHVLMLKGVCESPPLLVSELAEGGHLRRYLAERDWDFGIGVVLLKQVAHGMEYLHNLPKEIIHGDLKPENVLIDATGIAKIADFGLSRATDPTAPGQPACIPGTPGYIGPEVYDGVFDLPTDVFAWSMIAIEVVSEGNRQVLFRNRYEMIEARQQNLLPVRPYNPKISNGLWSLIKEAANFDDLERVDFNYVRKSLENNKWEVLQPDNAGSLGRSPNVTSTSSAAPASTKVQFSAVDRTSAIVAPLPNVSNVAVDGPSSTTTPVVPRHRIVLQVANGTYDNLPRPDSKNLSMASDSAFLLSKVLTSYYQNFEASMAHENVPADKIADLVRLEYKFMSNVSGTSVVHLIGHGGDDRSGHFVFQGTPEDPSIPQEPSKLDIEAQIVGQIPPDNHGQVVLLLDCCRGSTNSPERPFKTKGDNVVVGFAAEHGQKAYGCLYSFMLACELWERCNKENAPSFSWFTLLSSLKRTLPKQIDKLESQARSDGEDTTFVILEQVPDVRFLGRAAPSEERFLLTPKLKGPEADRKDRSNFSQLLLEQRHETMATAQDLQLNYPPALFVEDFFTERYTLTLEFEDGSKAGTGQTSMVAKDLLLNLYAVRPGSLGAGKVLRADLIRETSSLTAWATSSSLDPGQFVAGFVQEALEIRFGADPGLLTANFRLSPSVPVKKSKGKERAIPIVDPDLRLDWQKQILEGPFISWASLPDSPDPHILTLAHLSATDLWSLRSASSILESIVAGIFHRWLKESAEISRSRHQIALKMLATVLGVGFIEVGYLPDPPTEEWRAFNKLWRRYGGLSTNSEWTENLLKKDELPRYLIARELSGRTRAGLATHVWSTLSWMTEHRFIHGNAEYDDPGLKAINELLPERRAADADEGDYSELPSSLANHPEPNSDEHGLGIGRSPSLESGGVQWSGGWASGTSRYQRRLDSFGDVVSDGEPSEPPVDSDNSDEWYATSDNSEEEESYRKWKERFRDRESNDNQSLLSEGGGESVMSDDLRSNDPDGNYEPFRGARRLTGPRNLVGPPSERVDKVSRFLDRCWALVWRFGGAKDDTTQSDEPRALEISNPRANGLALWSSPEDFGAKALYPRMLLNLVVRQDFRTLDLLLATFGPPTRSWRAMSTVEYQTLRSFFHGNPHAEGFLEALAGRDLSLRQGRLDVNPGGSWIVAFCGQVHPDVQLVLGRYNGEAVEILTPDM